MNDWGRSGLWLVLNLLHLRALNQNASLCPPQSANYHGDFDRSAALVDTDLSPCSEEARAAPQVICHRRAGAFFVLSFWQPRRSWSHVKTMLTDEQRAGAFTGILAEVWWMCASFLPPLYVSPLPSAHALSCSHRGVTDGAEKQSVCVCVCRSGGGGSPTFKGRLEMHTRRQQPLAELRGDEGGDLFADCSFY